MAGKGLKIPHTHNERIVAQLKEALSICNLSKDISSIKQILENAIKKSECLEAYLQNMSMEETELQKSIFTKTLEEPWKNGNSNFKYHINMRGTRHSSQFLKIMAEVTGSAKIMEIGMFTGYTTAAFCSSSTVKEVVCLELDPFLEKFVRGEFKGRPEDKKLRIEIGPALDSLKKLEENGEVFDLAFVDADEANYANYYNFLMESPILKKGGVILMDNTLWRGELFPEPVGIGKDYAQLNELVKNDARSTQVILQICDGVSLVRKN